MFSIPPYVDVSSAVHAAEIATANLKPEGFLQVRTYLDLIFERWKLDYGVPPREGGYGLLGSLIQSTSEKNLSDDDRKNAVLNCRPVECAGEFCTNEIDLFVIIWTQYHDYLSQHTKKSPNLFFWFLGLLILDNKQTETANVSVANAGQILQRIFNSVDQETIASDRIMISVLESQAEGIRSSRKKGGEATAAIKKEKGIATSQEIHRRASHLLITHDKRDIVGVIKRATGYSNSTIRACLKSHESGLWK